MRPAAEVMAALAASGLTNEQLALVMELSASVACETRPMEDKAAERRRAKDREYQAKKRRGRQNLPTSADDPPPNESILTPTREEKPETKVSAKKSGFSAPHGVGDEQWSAFRKQRKKPLNERSYTLLCGKLAKLAEDGWPPGEMIDLAIERGWETVFEPRNFSGQQRTDSLGRNQSSDGLSPTTRAAIAVFGPGNG